MHVAGIKSLRVSITRINFGQVACLTSGKKGKIMRQILIVHSSADTRFEAFFTKVFLTVAVSTVWETYGGLLGGPAGKDRIQKEILDSDALFLILSTDEGFYTCVKDWFPWVAGPAQGKDIWVFEHCEDMKRIPALIPNPGHYVAYYITNAWCDYVTKMAEAYEKPMRDLSLPEAGCKPLTPTEEGSFFDPETGFALFDDSTARPIGLKAVCPVCSSSYGLHVPSEMKAVRCPSCGHLYGIQQPAKVSAATR